jgi:integrase
MKLTLTDKFVTSAKPGTYFDDKVAGLHLRVTAGAKGWSLIFTAPGGGKRTRMALGKYPATTLAQARARALEAHAELDAGNDPRGVVTAGVANVGDLIERYIAKRASTFKCAKETARRLRVDVLPIIGDVKLAELHRRDAIRVIDAIQDRGSRAAADRTFTDLHAMIAWAVSRGELDLNPLAGIKHETFKERERVLSEDEIRTSWAEWPAVLPAAVATALKLALVTGQRIGEITGMTTDEIDLGRKVWTIAAARSKNGHAHTVPLSGFAIELIGTPGDGRVFPYALDHLPQTVYRFKGKLSVKGWTPHDLRRTCCTKLAEIGIAPHVIGHVVNHRSTTKAGVTATVYNHYDYGAEKRDALELWANRLQAILAGDAAKIIPMRR